MGSCSSRHSVVVTPETISTREVKIVVFGLDNAGKSTLLANLSGESMDGITPTIGFSSAKLSSNRCSVTLYDVGGGPRIRGIWKNYFSEAYGVIYVVDSSSPERFVEAGSALKEVFSHERMTGKPLLVLANKQDIEGAFSAQELGNRMDVDTMSEHTQQLHMVECTSLRSASGGSDPRLQGGLNWLLQAIIVSYETIANRVRADVQAQREREAVDRRERMERVRRLREERERFTGQGGSVDCVDGPPANPFKPISVVAVEVEQRELANRRADQHTEAPRPREDIPVSQSSSTLSASQSLTDVTQPTGDAGSTESLHTDTPLPLDKPLFVGSNCTLEGGSRGNSPIIARRQRLEPIKGKRAKKEMLLSRLKNRNKIAPSLSQQPSPSSQPSNAPLVSQNTWTGGDLETVKTVDPLEGLPSLPAVRRTLPPIHTMLRGEGESSPFTTEQELSLVPKSAVQQVSYPPPIPA